MGSCRRLAALLGMSLLALRAAPQEGFSRDAWIADFEQLKAALTAGYPNLEWAAQRGMDLAALEARAREQLAAAGSPDAARNALTQFLSRFGDGHMSLTWPQAASPVTAAGVDAQPLCARLGYWSRPDTAAIARALPGYVALPDIRTPVSAGHFESSGRRVGVLRVSVFMPDTALCESAARELSVDPGKPCDDACSEKIARRADAMLVASIEDAVRKLVAVKPGVILADVAGNGGGNDSAIAAARMLTAQPLQTPRMQFVRGERRAADLRESAAELRSALRKSRGEETALLTSLVEKLDGAATEAGATCDLSPLWQNQPAACSNLVTGIKFAGGLIDEELPANLRHHPWSQQASSTALYEFTPALWTGPLVVLIDGSSGSATELFAAMLQDAGRAIVAGAPSVGSGCGWTLPRQEIELKNSGGRLLMPDCARLRRDGSNELDGIQPDLLIGFRRFDSQPQRVRRLEAALPQVIEQATKGSRPVP